MPWGPQGTHELGVCDFGRSLRLDPDNAVALAASALSNVGLGKQDLAIRDYDRAIEVDPGNERVLYSRGMVLMHLGEYGRAIDDFNTVLDIDPGIDAARAAIVLAGLKQAEGGLSDGGSG